MAKNQLNQQTNHVKVCLWFKLLSKCLLWGYCFGGVSYRYSWAPLGVWSHLLGCCKKDATRVWAVARRTGVGWSSDECQGFQHPWNGGLQWWQIQPFGRKPKEGPVFSFFLVSRITTQLQPWSLYNILYIYVIHSTLFFLQYRWCPPLSPSQHSNYITSTCPRLPVVSFFHEKIVVITNPFDAGRFERWWVWWLLCALPLRWGFQVVDFFGCFFMGFTYLQGGGLYWK